ncbi:MAG: DUF3416 domain-containing protein [SAR202 cluster bacterium]|nr:DUF3416 domain-containing protein [SAR202 cluster bacterium]
MTSPARRGQTKVPIESPPPPPRVAIEHVTPGVDGGRFPVKRIAGETVEVQADVFADGHDVVVATLLVAKDGEEAWNRVPMRHLGNDRWSGVFKLGSVGCYRYAVAGRVDHFETWRHDTLIKLEAGQDINVELEMGARLLEEVAAFAEGDDAAALRAAAAALRAPSDRQAVARQLQDEAVAAIMGRHGARFETSSPKLRLMVDSSKAAFSAWYELFPRSRAAEPGAHGTFRDVERQLPRIAAMGFDVLYFPPIHPIGRSFRKGKNNQVVAQEEDVGSPWAIGGPEGGHKAIHPQLGTLADFHHLVDAAKEHGIDIALDLAYQCSPDHPYVREHPEWFKRRPDGTVQYAENPPKKYQDIYPFDFETLAWRSLWDELKGIVDYWVAQGVRVFRVDNPHTKALPFWEWLIAEEKREHPDLIFLAEAFTRPRMMARLAKLGFTQSYTYFTWRNSRWELTQYLTELTRTELREYFRPNFWPNTPDILHATLQNGGRPAFMARLVLAATMSANYGIYGPAFELGEATPREPGSEEYLHSEKYEIKRWDLGSPASLEPLITAVNRIRRENPALRQTNDIHFHQVDNENVIAYSKRSGSNVVLIVVNLETRWTHSGWITLDLASLGLDGVEEYDVTDLVSGARFRWRGDRNYVELNPDVLPAHILRIEHPRPEPVTQPIQQPVAPWQEPS